MGRCTHECDCISIILRLIVHSIALIMKMLSLYKWSFSGCVFCRCRTRRSGCFCLYSCLLLKCLLTAAGTTVVTVIRRKAGAFELLSLIHWGAVWKIIWRKKKTLKERATTNINPISKYSNNYIWLSKECIKVNIFVTIMENVSN